MAQANQTKRQTVVSKSIVFSTEDPTMATGVQFEFSSGRTYAVWLESLTPHIFAHAAAHGIAQKGGDAAAMSRNPETGRSATEAEKIAAVVEVLDRITSSDGTWNLVREGGTGGGNLLFKALCRMYPTKTPEELREWLGGKSDDEKKAMRVNKKVAAIIAEIQAESVADVDSDELLDELE